jgi:hypothetical protein
MSELELFWHSLSSYFRKPRLFRSIAERDKIFRVVTLPPICDANVLIELLIG